MNIHLGGNARLDRDVRRVLIHREPSITGVTTGGTVSGKTKAQPAPMMLCPLGLMAVGNCDRRVASPALIMEIGSGPDGSSLTVDYQRYEGSGVEKLSGQPSSIRAANPVA